MAIAETDGKNRSFSSLTYAKTACVCIRWQWLATEGAQSPSCRAI